MKGKFISIEGPDGSGKSTQSKRVADYLQQKGYSIYLTREPGGTIIGEKVRDILLDPDNREIAFETEVLLYAAARAQIVAEKIKPYLERGFIVICDRFVDSSIAYQGYGRDKNIEYVKRINYLTIKDCIPDLTLLLDLPVEEGLKRVKTKGKFDRLEGEALDFHHRVRKGFLKIAANESKRVKVISANQEPEVVFKNMIKFIEGLLTYDC